MIANSRLVEAIRCRLVVAALVGLAACFLLVLAACSPAFDWRETRIEGPRLTVMFPCRPVSQVRDLELARRRVSMSLLACEAGGDTFAVASFDVGDPAAVGTALSSLRSAGQSKFAGEAGDADQSRDGATANWQVSGMTPQPEAGRWQWKRASPDGKSVRMDTAFFSRGTWVVQASVIGSADDVKANAPFFEGLRFVP